MSAPSCRDCGGRDFKDAPGTDDHGRCVECDAFPTLGFLAGEWIQDRCVIPDGDLAGDPYELTGEMWRFVLRFYRVDPFVRRDAATGRWRLPFLYVRGAQLVRPQKWGKGPFGAAVICHEGAPDGVAVFDGWDADGQPVGRPWSTPLIQVTAASEDQSENVYGALLPMIERGSLKADLDTGLGRINLPGGGKIEPVTSSALSRLGQRVTFAVQDQTESWLQRNGLRRLADTQRRGLGGMGGRWLSTANAWDPAEESVAQYTAEHEQDGVLHDDVDPGPGSVRNRQDRRRMLRRVYGDSWWVDVDRVDAEIAALVKRDPAQAERWYLNRKVAGGGRAFDRDAWDALAVDPPRDVQPGALVVAAVDGARFRDALAIVACEVESGYVWVVGVWERPDDAADGYQHPMRDVDAAFAEMMDTFDVWRVYADPQKIGPQMEAWEGRYGDKRVVPWYTNRPRQAAFAVRNFMSAVAAGDVSHDGSEVLSTHIGNAYRHETNVVDTDPDSPTFREKLPMLAKDRNDSPNKIDAADAAWLAWEARGDAIAAGAQPAAPFVFEVY